MYPKAQKYNNNVDILCIQRYIYFKCFPDNTDPLVTAIKSLQIPIVVDKGNKGNDKGFQ